MTQAVTLSNLIAVASLVSEIWLATKRQADRQRHTHKISSILNFFSLYHDFEHKQKHPPQNRGKQTNNGRKKGKKKKKTLTPSLGRDNLDEVSLAAPLDSARPHVDAILGLGQQAAEHGRGGVRVVDLGVSLLHLAQVQSSH